MSSFSLKLNTDNDAFAEDPALEVARILREAADKLESGCTGSQLRDGNGNKVGQFTLDIDE
jgi:hypothetical protein